VRSIDGIILSGETEVPGEKHFPVSLRPPQITHGLAQDRTRAFLYVLLLRTE